MDTRMAQEGYDMKSALALIAFANAPQMTGIIALLETAMEALDRAEKNLAAAYVEHTIHLLRSEEADEFEGLPSHS